MTNYFWIDTNNQVKSCLKEKINIETLKEELHWDFDNVWTTGRRNTIKDIYFNKENYYEELPMMENAIIIKTAEDLYEFANKVNKGFKKYQNANVILKKNIDLKGKKWIPIGVDEYNPFCGTFNGNGHVIENFKIYQNKLNYVGFFGYIKGATICNLRIDCICKANRYLGALVGLNDQGNILSCGVVTNIHVGEVTGGLVGRNKGKISKCYAVGKMMYSILLFPFVVKSMIAILIVAVIVGLIIRYLKKNMYVPVAIDPNVVVDTQGGEEFSGNANDNKASFDFSQTIQVDASSGIGTFDFRNPKRGNYNIVVKLFMSDEELKQKVGATGRTKEEQVKLEQEEGYDASTTMTELYRSGLIERGYRLPRIQISDLKDGTKLPIGQYEAIISLEFYKIDTNEKAIVNTNLPVTLNVE